MKKTIASLTICLTLLSAATALAADRLVIIVRHAEKETDSMDPSLTAEGRARAAALAKALAGTRIDHVISTPVNRNTETAAPVVEASGATLELIDVLAGGLEAQLASVLLRQADDRGQVTLSQAQLAALLGVQRTSVQRVLKSLDDAGLVEVGYRRIELVDRGGLASLLAVGLVQLWRDLHHPLAWLTGLGAIVKIVLEISSGQTLLTQTAWPSVPEVHAVGFLSGLALAVVIAASGDVSWKTDFDCRKKWRQVLHFIRLPCA